MADALVSEASDASHEGSTPSLRINEQTAYGTKGDVSRSCLIWILPASANLYTQLRINFWRQPSEIYEALSCRY